jgi:hypothetical protein
MRRFRSLNDYLRAGLYVGLDYGGAPQSGPFPAISLAHKCISWPHSRVRDCYVAEPSVCIRLMPLSSTAELRTEYAAELQSGPATKLGVASQWS